MARVRRLLTFAARSARSSRYTRCGGSTASRAAISCPSVRFSSALASPALSRRWRTISAALWSLMSRASTAAYTLR